MNVIDMLRREYAVQRYEFWLELRGVRGRRRRALRQELRANLGDAAADVGMTAALFGIGSPRQLAHESSPLDPDRPRWVLGFLWATIAFALTVLGLMFAAFNGANGVIGAGVTGRDVRFDLFPFLGAQAVVRVAPDHGGIVIGVPFGLWWLLGLPFLVFLFTAQPWRLLRRRGTVASIGAA